MGVTNPLHSLHAYQPPREDDTMRLFLAIFALGVSAALHAGVPEGSIADFIDRGMPAPGAPGLAFAVVENGGVTSVDARGLVRIGGDQKVTPDTDFLTGSISRSFTALAIMQLVEAGSIDLEAELSDHLDSFSDLPSGAIAIRQLLSHASGFYTLQGNASHRRDDAAPQRHHRQGDRARLRRRRVPLVADSPVHRHGAPADHLRAQHHLGLASPARYAPSRE